MSICIEESGLSFGDYNEDDFFHIEQSDIYHKLGEGIKTIEFFLYRGADELFLIEAKSSAPKPKGNADFEKFILDISEKFTHSLDLFFSVVISRTKDTHREIPRKFKAIKHYETMKIKLILVLNGHQIEWLPPIKDALARKLIPQIKIWQLNIVVLNHVLAAEYNLIKNRA
jgi:hypothetical protein